MKQTACTALPEGYREIFAVDLQNNKKLALLVNGIAAAIAVIMAAVMLPFVPISSLFDLSDGLGPYALRFAVLALGSVAYIILHELVHGITMKFFGAGKIKYGFTGIYAYAGCADLFPKSSYIVIALAPVVLWGAVLALLNFLVPLSWFWVVYLIQITNLSGAAGDLYVTVKFCRLPRDILVADDGTAMRVYSAE